MDNFFVAVVVSRRTMEQILMPTSGLATEADCDHWVRAPDFTLPFVMDGCNMAACMARPQISRYRARCGVRRRWDRGWRMQWAV